MTRMARCFTVLFSIVAAVSLGCDPQQPAGPPPDLSLHHNQERGNPDCRLNGRGEARGPVDFLCAIEIPGNPITSSAKGWVEQSNATYFLTDASNLGVDVLDVRTHTFVGRVVGMAGNAGVGGGTASTNGPGPSSFVSAPARSWRDRHDWRRHHRGPDRVLWVSDGNSTVHVVDMDRQRILASISTAIPACDGGTETTHYCGRSNEINYDPAHHVILVSNPSPLALAAPHGVSDGYSTFISASYPYKVLGHITWPGAGNVEGHVWVPELRRFLLPIQPTAANQATKGSMYIAVINTRTRLVEDKRVYFCPEIPGTTANSTGNNNLQLAGRNLWAQMCGRPIRMNARTGAILNVVTKVGTGDEDWFNPGDGNFYVTGADSATGVSSLGVMNAFTGAWLQNVPNVTGASPSAFAETNEIFTRVVVTPAAVTNPALDLSRCVVKGRGCVVVFAHTKVSKHGKD